MWCGRAIRPTGSPTREAFLHLRFGTTPGNAELRERRAHRNELEPGDILFVPERRPKKYSCAVDRRHRFVRSEVPALLRLQALQDFTPRKNEAYRLGVDGLVFTGSTDGDGRLEHYVPPLAESGRLTLTSDGTIYEFAIGSLEAREEVPGIQRRLANLGFDCPQAGELGPLTQAALRTFQDAYCLEVTGEADQPTKDKLLELAKDAQVKGLTK